MFQTDSDEISVWKLSKMKIKNKEIQISNENEVFKK